MDEKCPEQAVAYIMGVIINVYCRYLENPLKASDCSEIKESVNAPERYLV